MKTIRSSWFPILLGMIILVVIINETLFSPQPSAGQSPIIAHTSTVDWQAPDINDLANDQNAAAIRYGRELIMNTALFFGPKGKIAPLTNGMNCSNCHLDAGAKPFGGCFSAVASTYPRYRERSGRIESIQFRINDCMMRSLNGKPVDSTGKEMNAMIAYLTWIGGGVQKGVKPAGAGLADLPFLDRAADPAKGQLVFQARCTSCHGDEGQGLLSHDSSIYLYPPLWGDHSFNVSAGLYRISRIASFIKFNMPYGQASFDAPALTDEEAWDVAAFIVSKPRPEKFFAEDWPKRASKPVDYPFGPYVDQYTERQHKYGPFRPISQKK